MSVKIRPVGKKILLRVLEAKKEQVVGGIVLPANQGNRDKRREAVVQALGNGYVGDLVTGDTVLIKPFCGQELLLNGERLVFCKEAEIEAVVE